MKISYLKETKTKIQLIKPFLLKHVKLLFFYGDMCSAMLIHLVIVLKRFVLLIDESLYMLLHICGECFLRLTQPSIGQLSNSHIYKVSSASLPRRTLPWRWNTSLHTFWPMCRARLDLWIVCSWRSTPEISQTWLWFASHIRISWKVT